MKKVDSNGWGQWAAVAVAVAMAGFSSYIFLRTGDWVALIFLLGSMAYAAFFIFYKR